MAVKWHLSVRHFHNLITCEGIFATLCLQLIFALVTAMTINKLFKYFNQSNNIFYIFIRNQGREVIRQDREKNDFLISRQLYSQDTVLNSFQTAVCFMKPI